MRVTERQIKEWAELVFHAIPSREQGGTWKTRNQIAQETGLTYWQVRRGVAYITELFRDDSGITPLASCNQGYLFTCDKIDISGYVSAGCLQAATLILNRYWRGIRPFLLQTGDTAAVARNDRAINRLVEDARSIPAEMVI